MARVPLQTELSQEYAGGEVQLTAQTVDPRKDVVSDDLKAQGKALQGLSEVVGKLDDEIDDAEAKELYNKFYYDTDGIRRDYLEKKGALAVATVPNEVEGGEPLRPYDVANNKIKAKLEEYSGYASNGTVRYMFENMASVTVRANQTSMINHSLKEQRAYADNERKIKIDNDQNLAIINAATWKDPESPYNIHRMSGLKLLEEQAISEGLITQGEQPSEEWLLRVRAYNLKIHKGVIDELTKVEDWDGIKDYLRTHYESGDMSKEEVAMFSISVAEKHKDFNSEHVVDAILTNNNPIDYSFTNIANLTLCLAANNSVDNNIGGHCVDSFHSNEFQVGDFNDQEKISILEQKKNQSVYYQPNAVKTIPETNRAPHLFAIQVLDVKKADKLYRQAVNSVGVIKSQYDSDPKYKREIDAKVLEKFKELFNKEVKKKYSPKVDRIEKSIRNIELSAGSKGIVPGSIKDDQIKELKEKLAIEQEKDGGYTNQVITDMETLTNGITYAETDFVTGLQPLDVYLKNLENTIKDPKQLEYAKEDLTLKHNQITQQKTAEYRQALGKAEEIAFAEKGGWKNLEAAGIDINSFKPEDIAMLKRGYPETSDQSVTALLVDNPAAIRDGVTFYRSKLNEIDYRTLTEYANKLRNPTDFIEATGNSTMFKATLARNDLGYKTGDDKYYYLYDAWNKRINAAQIANGNRKLTMAEKQIELDNLLLDEVNVDLDKRLGFIPRGDKKNVNISFVDPDNLDNVYVDVQLENKKTRVFTAKIDPDVKFLIKNSLRKAGKPITEMNIAEYWLILGSPENVTQAKQNAKTY